MTADDLAELDRLLAEYRAAMSRANFIAKGKTRKPLETALVRHAEDLIEMADRVIRRDEDGCIVDVSSAEFARAAAKYSRVAKTDDPD